MKKMISKLIVTIKENDCISESDHQLDGYKVGTKFHGMGNTYYYDENGDIIKIDMGKNTIVFK